MRHRFHSICPYFAMFPEDFVRKQLVWSERGDIIFDPFSGRGTTVFESLLNNRYAGGCDTNPVAVCVSNAKANPPKREQVLHRVDEIAASTPLNGDPIINDPFFKACYHPHTLNQILHFKKNLKWRTRNEDEFIAAIILGVLHGESHRTNNCLSNRMPRTIATKPEYSLRWWNEHGYIAPKRNVYEIVINQIDYRYATPPAKLVGRVAECDARQAAPLFPEFEGRVSLVITSPPYIDTTDYSEDQWLRLWFLGGPPMPRKHNGGDDRHRNINQYWQFLLEAWEGISALLGDGAHIVIRIGAKRIPRENIKSSLIETLSKGFNANIRLVDESSSEIIDGQMRAFCPGKKGIETEHDFHFLIN